MNARVEAEAPLLCRFPEMPDGLGGVVLLVDKPSGITSFDVLRRLRRLLGVSKMGHGGTLDPMASGLLLCLIGSATPLAGEVLGMDKVYHAQLRLGATTPSHDADTPVEERRPWKHVTRKMVEEAFAAQIGPRVQVTPAYAAARHGGERLYRKARRGEKVTLPPRQVRIDELELLGMKGPLVDFRMRCSSGTYVRAVARDAGDRLGCGAHLTSLRRTEVGAYGVEDAWPLELFELAFPIRYQSPYERA